MTDDNDLFEIADPPASKKGAPRPDVAAARRYADSHPGVWVKVSKLSTGTFTFLKHHDYEATARGRVDGKIDLYFRRPEGWQP